MKTTDAKKFLAVAGEILDRRQIMVAYRRRVFNAHPDRGGDQSEAADIIHRAKRARDILLRSIEVSECDKCKGKGEIIVRGGFSGALRCGKCDGRGYY